MSWFGEAKALLEMRKTRLALERIATVLEAQYLREGGRGFTSLYTDESEEHEGEVISMGDADFAEMEKMEEERRVSGGAVGMDEDLREWRR